MVIAAIREGIPTAKRPLRERLENAVTSLRMMRLNSAIVDLAHQADPSRSGFLPGSITRSDDSFTVPVQFAETPDGHPAQGQVTLTSDMVGLKMAIETHHPDGGVVNNYTHPPAEGSPPIDATSSAILRGAQLWVATQLKQ